MKSCNERSLILIDEFGGGTEPQIGGAIAEAVLKRFNQKGTFGVITTHYQNLKHFAEDHDCLLYTSTAAIDHSATSPKLLYQKCFPLKAVQRYESFLNLQTF